MPPSSEPDNTPVEATRLDDVSEIEQPIELTQDFGSAAFRAKLLAHFKAARDKAIAGLLRQD